MTHVLIQTLNLLHLFSFVRFDELVDKLGSLFNIPLTLILHPPHLLSKLKQLFQGLFAALFSSSDLVRVSISALLLVLDLIYGQFNLRIHILLNFDQLALEIIHINLFEGSFSEALQKHKICLFVETGHHLLFDVVYFSRKTAHVLVKLVFKSRKTLFLSLFRFLQRSKHLVGFGSIGLESHRINKSLEFGAINFCGEFTSLSRNFFKSTHFDL